MFSAEELVKNTGYWLDQIQNELHFELRSYMEQKDLNQKELAEELGFSKGYISQILNGNFNHSLKKMIDLSLAIKRVPKIEFVDMSEEVKRLKNLTSTKIIFIEPTTELSKNDFLGSKKLKYA